jgi:hypothetical protein
MFICGRYVAANLSCQRPIQTSTHTAGFFVCITAAVSGDYYQHEKYYEQTLPFPRNSKSLRNGATIIQYALLTTSETLMPQSDFWIWNPVSISPMKRGIELPRSFRMTPRACLLSAKQIGLLDSKEHPADFSAWLEIFCAILSRSNSSPQQW